MLHHRHTVRNPRQNIPISLLRLYWTWTLKMSHVLHHWVIICIIIKMQFGTATRLSRHVSINNSTTTTSLPYFTHTIKDPLTVRADGTEPWGSSKKLVWNSSYCVYRAPLTFICFVFRNIIKKEGDNKGKHKLKSLQTMMRPFLFEATGFAKKSVDSMEIKLET